MQENLRQALLAEVGFQAIAPSCKTCLSSKEIADSQQDRSWVWICEQFGKVGPITIFPQGVCKNYQPK